LAEVLPPPSSMAAKLRLVTGRERDTEQVDDVQEDRYQFPADREVWEVSCEPEQTGPPQPTMASDRRRAS
jgi:hypothetical protein